MILSAHKVTWKTSLSVEKMKHINTQRGSAVLAVFFFKGCLASLLKNQNRRKEKDMLAFEVYSQSLFTKRELKKRQRF